MNSKTGLLTKESDLSKIASVLIPGSVIGNTTDSGSVIGGSSPPREVLDRRSLRLTVRTGDSHSSNRGSIPLGTDSRLTAGFFLR